jgi:hypothetical protein
LLLFTSVQDCSSIIITLHITNTVTTRIGASNIGSRKLSKPHVLTKHNFRLGWFFESGSIGRVPNQFEIPFIFETGSERTTSISHETVHTEIDEILMEDEGIDTSKHIDKKTS